MCTLGSKQILIWFEHKVLGVKDWWEQELEKRGKDAIKADFLSHIKEKIVTKQGNDIIKFAFHNEPFWHQCQEWIEDEQECRQKSYSESSVVNSDNIVEF